MTDRPAGQPRKILRIIARLNVGGPARHVVLLNSGLDARGYTTLLVHGSVDAHEASMEHLAASHHIRTVNLPQLGRRVTLVGDVRAFWSLLVLVFQEAPDVIHTHTAKAGALGRVAALVFNSTRRRRRRCLVVHTFHGHVFTGYFGRIGNAAARSIERALSRITDCVIAISASQSHEIATRFAVAPARKIRVVPLGLDLDRLLGIPAPARSAGAKLRFGFAPDDVVVTYVGRFAPVKDLETLLHAFAQARATVPNLRLLMVGDGELRPKLESQARRLGTEATFIGWHLDLVDVYSCADIICLSSRNEGTPVALIEGMAAGRPVVATAVGGVPDLVSHGDNGFLVSTGNVSGLATSIEALAVDHAMRARMGAAARLSVREHFTADRLVLDMSALYERELRQKRNGSLR